MSRSLRLGAVLPPVGLVACGLLLSFAISRGESNATHDHDMGTSCTSCSAHGHVDGPLATGEVDSLLDRFSREPLTEGSVALETLLYHGAQVRAALAKHGHGLDAERRAFLDRELARTRAIASFRIVDADGVIRAEVDAAPVEIGVKAHLRARTTRLQEPEFNGTVVRVGLNHLWARF